MSRTFPKFFFERKQKNFSYFNQLFQLLLETISLEKVDLEEGLNTRLLVSLLVNLLIFDVNTVLVTRETAISLSPRTVRLFSLLRARHFSILATSRVTKLKFLF